MPASGFEFGPSDFGFGFGSPLCCLGLLLAGALAGPAQTKTMNDSTNHLEVATLGGGCFWCTEAMFQMLPGVKSVTSGYAGGTKENPDLQGSLRRRHRPRRGHPDRIRSQGGFLREAAGDLLGGPRPDHPEPPGRRQRHAIPLDHSLHSEAQKAAAEKSKAEAQKQFRQPIVTEIVPLKKFYPAEDYHQDYYRDNPNQPYCRMVIRPKVEKFEKKLKAEKPTKAAAVTGGRMKNGGPLPGRRSQRTQPRTQMPFWIMNLSRSATRQL